MKLDSLSNYDIINLMKNEKNFNSVFISDTLPNKIKPNENGIINLDIDAHNGTHWVAYYNDDNNNYVEYIDSFGIGPNKNTEKFLRTSNKQIIFNTTDFQNILSDACGYFAMYYIKERNKGKSMYDVLYSFSIDNTNNNEQKLINYFHS
jgi:hypothetical protein